MKKYMSNNNKTRNNEDAVKYLKRTAHKLIIDCERYDNGDLDALFGDASLLRMLFYETNVSHPLINKFNPNSLTMFSFFQLKHDLDYGPMEYARFKKYNKIIDTFLFCPIFSEEIRGVSFYKWWNDDYVFKLGNTKLTRKEVVRIGANQIGSAHFDDKVNTKYYDLLNGDTGYHLRLTSGEWVTPTNLQHAIMRAIIHETIISLKNASLINEDYQHNFNYNITKQINVCKKLPHGDKKPRRRKD